MTLVTPGNLFLEKVFEAIPLVDLEVVKVRRRTAAVAGAQPGELAQLRGDEARRSSVFHRKVPDALAARATSW